MRSGDRATVFDGTSQYLEVPDAPALSVPTNGALTIEAWIRPDVLDFPSEESDGYVHFLGKGVPNQHEYVLRMYSLSNSVDRPNRISGYAFNLTGGLGSGSYFQDPVVAGRWIYVVVIIDATTAAQNVRIYKNGLLRKTTSLSQFGVTPRAGTAPLRIGTRDFGSFFKGAMSKIALYHYSLSPEQLHKHFMQIAKWR